MLGLKRGAFLLGPYAAMTSSAIRPSLARRISAALMHRQASVWDLPGQDGTFRQDVVGESFHAGQFALLLKGVHVDSNGVDLFEKASLVPERRNEFDPLSVAVVIRGQRVGHLPRGDAARLQPTLLAATKAGQDPQVDALVYARADGERSGMIWHRVRLDLAPLKSSPQREGDARPPAPAADAAFGGGRTRHGWAPTGWDLPTRRSGSASTPMSWLACSSKRPPSSALCSAGARYEARREDQDDGLGGGSGLP